MCLGMANQLRCLFDQMARMTGVYGDDSLLVPLASSRSWGLRKFFYIKKKGK